MTDHRGLWEHARYTTPRTEHGYCTDDNARALIITCREPNRADDLVDLAVIYLAFLRDAQLPAGGFHNRRDRDGTWSDDVGPDDSQGRALWALGSVAHRGIASWMRWEGIELFERNAGFDSPSPRANALVILGAAEVLAASAENLVARRLLEQCADRIHPRDDASWPWPEDRLAYDNARIAEALLAAGEHLSDESLVDNGLGLLQWLVEAETRDGHFSFTPVGGWAPGEPRPGFDQQPVEAAAMADACARAWSLTGDEQWRARVVLAGRWFLGANDTGALLYDPRTGGGCDGLTPEGANQNQGAESTLAVLSVLQQARSVA
ncbi:MAG: glycosyltransferase [Acidimicrobiia bacterium]